MYRGNDITDSRPKAPSLAPSGMYTVHDNLGRFSISATRLGVIAIRGRDVLRHADFGESQPESTAPPKVCPCGVSMACLSDNSQRQHADVIPRNRRLACRVVQGDSHRSVGVVRHGQFFVAVCCSSIGRAGQYLRVPLRCGFDSRQHRHSFIHTTIPPMQDAGYKH